MKAPDKIYRSYFYDSASEVFQSAPAEDADTCTEYIRKDALLEWIDERQNSLEIHDDYEDGRYDALVDVIEKIESL